MSSNIIIIILILLAIGTFIYLYHNRDNDPIMEETVETEKKIITTKKKAQPEIDSISLSPQEILSPLRKKPKIDIGDILSDNTERDPRIPRGSLRSPVGSPVGSDSEHKSPMEIDLDDIIPKKYKINPSNLDSVSPEETWDASFGLPLMSKDEKRDYFAQMQKNHKKYENSISDFAKYQMDRSTIIQTETTINPFKPDHRSKSLRGRAVKDIYDEQIAGPKAKPKRVKKRTRTGIVYENESELNGGTISGTKMHGFDGINDSHKTAAFGNEF